MYGGKVIQAFSLKICNFIHRHVLQNVKHCVNVTFSLTVTHNRPLKICFDSVGIWKLPSYIVFFPQFSKNMNIQESHNQGFVVGVEHIPSTTCPAGCLWYNAAAVYIR